MSGKQNLCTCDFRFRRKNGRQPVPDSFESSMSHLLVNNDGQNNFLLAF